MNSLKLQVSTQPDEKIVRYVRSRSVWKKFYREDCDEDQTVSERAVNARRSQRVDVLYEPEDCGLDGVLWLVVVVGQKDHSESKLLTTVGYNWSGGIGSPGIN